MRGALPPVLPLNPPLIIVDIVGNLNLISVYLQRPTFMINFRFYSLDKLGRTRTTQRYNQKIHGVFLYMQVQIGAYTYVHMMCYHSGQGCAVLGFCLSIYQIEKYRDITRDQSILLFSLSYFSFQQFFFSYPLCSKFCFCTKILLIKISICQQKIQQ